MKKTTLQRVLALALSLCLLLGMGILPKAEAVTDNWQTVYTQNSTKVEVNANDPFNATFITRASAYYTKKIDVQTGTKISFDVNFPAITSGEVMQYGIALMDRPNATHNYANYGNGGSANGLAVELVSTGDAVALKATVSKMDNGVRPDWSKRTDVTITSAVANPRNTTDVYNFTFEKLAETGEKSWKVTITRPNGTSAPYQYSANDIPQDWFANGAYVAVSCMNNGTHSLAVSNLKVVQPNATTNWRVVQHNSNGKLTLVTDNPVDATFENYVTGNYNQKINVKEGTTISFKVNFPKITDGTLLQYGFALVDTPDSFYTNHQRNNMYLELSSVPTQAKALKATAAYKRSGETSRTTVHTITAGLAQVPNTEDVYEVTFKKINETVNDVNYSWSLALRKYNAAGQTPYSIVKYTAEQIPHDMFANGAYFAVGSLAGSTTHTVKVTDFMVSNWDILSSTIGATHDLRTESTNTFNAAFSNPTTGYYNQKIEVVDGMTISMKVKAVVLKESSDMQFGIYLANAPKYFGSTGSGKSLGVEVTSLSAFKYDLRAVTCARVPGRTPYGNHVLGSRNTTTAYTLTFEKLPASEANSWKVTVTNGATVLKDELVADTVIPDDMFNDGLYISAGSLNSVTGHSMSVFDLEITRPDAVAYVGSVPYGDIQKAVEVANGEAVVLKKDIALTEALDLTDKAVTLDLDGKTLSGAENLTLGAGTDLTVKGGSLEGKLALAADGAKLTADCPIALELNGKTATVNAKNVTLTDSGTDDGTEGGKVYGNITPANTVTKEGNISYVALPGEDANGKYYTANAVRVAVKKVNIRPSAAGMYFTTDFKFNKNVVDAIASANNAAAEGEKNNGYGVVLSLEAKPGADFMAGAKGEAWTVGAAPTAGDNFISTGNSCLVKDIFKDTTPEENAQRGATDIYANAYVKIGDTIIMAENPTDVVYSMKTVMQILNTMVRDELTAGVLSENSLKARAFYETWQSAMSGWNLDAMAKENDKGADA